MKKFFAILLAMLLVLSMGVSALAEETTTDQETVTIKKVYQLVGAGSSPAETFTLEQVGNGTVKDGDATDAPALGTITGAAFAEGAATAVGAEGQITITLPEYTKVGVYEYTLKEKAGTTAGVTYYGNDIKLIVTVVNGENGKLRIAAVHTESTGAEKSDSFPNTYSAGTLNITKTVTGTLGDKTKLFDFSVTFTAPEEKTAKSTISYVDGTETKTLTFGEDGKATATFKLNDAASITFTNIPAGVTYTVTESDYSAEGYTTKVGENETNKAEGTITAAEQTAAFTNTKNGDIDTGITTDTLPYAVLLGLVVLAGAALLLKRRMGTND